MNIQCVVFALALSNRAVWLGYVLCDIGNGKFDFDKMIVLFLGPRQIHQALGHFRHAGRLLENIR